MCQCLSLSNSHTYIHCVRFYMFIVFVYLCGIFLCLSVSDSLIRVHCMYSCVYAVSVYLC